MVEDDKPDALDRLSVRGRPEGAPIMHQNWGKLLFLHWPVRPELVRPLVPERLEIDTFRGSAWVGVVPFTMWGVRLSFAPPVPFTSEFHELNVRTYVHLDGVPGVWFFSLDASNAAAVFAARTFFHLPYFSADISLEEREDRIHYRSRRREEPPAEFEAEWRIGGRERFAVPDTLEFFLVERYCLYAAHRQKLYRGRIHHEPYPLHDATLFSLDSTMVEAAGLPTPKDEPLIHYSDGVEVNIWPLTEA
jgi:uncharacterized protein